MTDSLLTWALLLLAAFMGGLALGSFLFGRRADAVDRLAAGVERATRLVEHDMRLSAEDVSAVVSMGPSVRHTRPAEIQARVAALAEPVTATLSVNVTTWRRPAQR